MTEFHFIRPVFLLLFIPYLIFLLLFFQSKYKQNPWYKVCDKHLLDFLLVSGNKKNSIFNKILLFTSLFFMIIALSGPAIHKKEVPIYKKADPFVVVLDMSEDMFINDINPSRFTRAKFKLKSIFTKAKDLGQFGMVVYTKEPFILSPLTQDANTIVQLLDALNEDVMPIQGQNLSLALKQAQELITQAGFSRGNILVLTANYPTKEDLTRVSKISEDNIFTSIMPVLKPPYDDNSFIEFAKKGHGKYLVFTNDNKDITNFVNAPSNQIKKQTNNLLVWQDEGIKFLIPALILLLPFFRRGWLDKVRQ